MSDCPSLPSCPFFNDKMKALPGVTGLYKQQYCRGNYSECARFRVSAALGRASVPSELYPTQHDKANLLIAPASKAR